MGNSKFFTNDLSNSLFDKFKGIIEDMAGLHSFHAVAGYFRSSGYFKIRKEFETMAQPPKIQILVVPLRKHSSYTRINTCDYTVFK